MIWIRRSMTAIAVLFALLALSIGFLPSFHSLKTFIVGAVAGMSAPTLEPRTHPKPSSIIHGEATLYGGTLETWTALDTIENVLEVGVRVPMVSIEKAPVMDGMTMHHDERTDRRIMPMPVAAQTQTILEHLDLYYAPMGHGPSRFARAHYDFHFFSISPSEVKKIDCRDLRLIDQSRLPRGYQEGVPPFASAKDVCVPEMGIHAVNVLQFLGQNGAFEADLLIPHYGAQALSLEPMITREKLLKRQSFNIALPAITYWSNPRAVPSFFEARFDAQKDAYNFVFGGFQIIQP
jgi:hypothetical protein